MKKIISMILAVAMAMSLITVVPVRAADAWLWPTSVTNITGGYTSNHKALDIGLGSAYAKAPIYASKSGKVVLSYDGCVGCKSDYGKYNKENGNDKNYCRHNKPCGNYVIIDHGNGVYSRYLHLYWDGVAEKGTTVKQGDIIGYMGSTGRSSGTHLHFDIWKNGTGASGGTVLGGTRINCSKASINYVYTPGETHGGNVTVTPKPHSHSYREEETQGHPHTIYKVCSCGYREKFRSISYADCSSCYPIGNVTLTREFSKTGGWVTFYRNNVANATSYSLEIYKDGYHYYTYDMTSTSLNVTKLPAGNYTATLIAKNRNTNKSKTSSCSSFTIADSYAIYYNANGGTNAPGNDEKIEGVGKNLSTQLPKREHYVFKGWARSKNATVAEYASGEVYQIDANVTLYAVWEPETYTINFDANGGKGELESITVTYGNTMRMPNTIIKDGYYLKGWSKSKGATTPDYRLGLDYKPETDMMLYAVWGQSTWSGDVAISFAGGDGTQNNPYQISNAAELALLAQKVNTQGSSFDTPVYYKLTDNIDLGYNPWVPIGLGDASGQFFKGSFNGNGYTISGLYVSSDEYKYYGLFGVVNNSSIHNFTLTGDFEDIDIADRDVYMGGVVGRANTSYISNVNVSYFDISNVTASNSNTAVAKYIYVGSVAGGLSYGSITNCNVTQSTISVENESVIAYTGGVCGAVTGGIENCSVVHNGVIFGRLKTSRSIWFGGISGNGGTIKNCSVTAGRLTHQQTVDGAVFGGGICGYASSVDGCSVIFTNKETVSFLGKNIPYSAYLTAKGFGVGTLGGISASSGTITNCKYDGASLIMICTNTNGWNYPSVGGICAGSISGETTVKNCVSNVDGILYCSGPGQYIFAGGILGMGTSLNGEPTLANLLTIVDSVTAINTQGTSMTGPDTYEYGGFAGDIAGFPYEEDIAGESMYTNDDLTVSATSLKVLAGTTKSEEKIKTRIFQKSLLGLKEYTSVANLEKDSSAVWVLRDGDLPELYYNCLNYVTVSNEIVNGSVTVDREQAVDGEIVTVTVTPADGYVLNKIYVNGEEIAGTTFAMSGASEVYATFAEIIPEYEVSLTADENATGTLVNMDSAEPMLMSVIPAEDNDASIVANDGEEIQVNTLADEDYTVDAIYVNGEEIIGNSFILTEDTVVTMDVTSISTGVETVTNDAEDVSDYSAVLSGTVITEGEGISRYIRYWSADDTETVYTTDFEEGSGDYTIELFDLAAETTYYYQMTEFGEVKTFTTCEAPEDAGTDGDDEETEDEETLSITSTTYSKTEEEYIFNIECSYTLTTEVLYVAVYSESNKLIAVKPAEVNGDSAYDVPFPIDSDIKYAKVFVWGSTDNLQPIAEAETVYLTE